MCCVHRWIKGTDVFDRVNKKAIICSHTLTLLVKHTVNVVLSHKR